MTNATKNLTTMQQATARRQQVIDELTSEAHYERVETRAYGHHDPFDVPVFACDTCGHQPIIQTVLLNRRWDARCPGCMKAILSHQRHEWQARLYWAERNLGSLGIQDIPLFGIQRLTLPEAKTRLSGIRRDLELRIALAGCDTAIARLTSGRAPGHVYRAKMEAYLRWSMLALALIKHLQISANDGGVIIKNRARQSP